ncbi:MAG: FHA domain-containing protein [Oscillospiraceae bacterium]|nr:FHA domain-containing protein [Oscillospiraceae bacterium]
MSSINCKIESRNDFLTGTYLVTSISDSDLDQNALHTIQKDCPQFIMPFNYKCINGQVEFTYKVGSLCKLQYFYGDVTHTEYMTMWRSMLSPLLECGDWHMNSRSFVLCTDYLYYDKSKKTVVYIYIPSKCECSSFEAFNDMAITVAKNITVSDPVLENKVLRSIINDFNPRDFLKMLMEYTPPQAIQETEVLDEIDGLSVADIADEEKSGFKVFGSRHKKEKETKHNGYKNVVPVNLPPAAQEKPQESIDNTQETKELRSGPGFRLVGKASMPQIIDVEVSDGGMFTIGRFDASVGKKQSSFEFDKKTKAVSRRHAVIEREGSVYKIIDLSSSAGTFINDKKLPPNTQHELTAGSRVSFGNMGADYVWE